MVTPKGKDKPEDHSLAKEVPEGVSVSEVLSLAPINLNTVLQEKYKQREIGKIRYLFFKAVLKIYSVIYYRMVIIDWYDGWIPFGFNRGKQIINKENIDLIYVHGQPPSSFVIGFLLKKSTGKPLVMDYDDAWTTSVYAKEAKGVKSRICQYLEQEILKTADGVIFVKKGTIETIKERFSDIDEKKFVLITNGYDSDDFRGLKKEKRSKFTITYTGRLSEKFCYSPESFLYALGKLIAEKKILKDEIQIVFAGTVSSNYQVRLQNLMQELDLEDVIKFPGFVNHKECIKYLINSDLLLLIIESIEGKEQSYKFSGSIPAKMFEYIYAGVPILAIVPPGFEADLIKRSGTGFVAEPNDVDSVKNLLYELYQKYKKDTLKIQLNREEINKYDRKVLTGELAAVFDEVLSGDRRLA